MSLESSIEKLIATIEAHTGVLVTMTAKNPAAAEPPPATKANGNGAVHPTPPAVTKRGPGRPPKAPAPAVQEPADDDLGDDTDGLHDESDSGLDDEPTPPPGPSPEEAKASIFAYRDAVVAAQGKEQGLSATRTLMHKHAPNIDSIGESNAQAIHDAFTKALATLKKGK